MKIIPRDSIIIRDRQRKKITTSELNEMRQSILDHGLFQCPMVFPLGGEKYLLVVGERRTRAMDLIAKESGIFSFDGLAIGPGEVPVTFTELESPLQHKRAELEENIIRVDLTWQERAEALADIHRLAQEKNPHQTIVQTAQELAQRGGLGGAKAPGTIENAMRESLLISEHLDDPAIAKARNATEAHSLILKKQEEKLNAIRIKRRLAALPAQPDVVVRCGDALEILPKLDPQSFDLLCADPPYGIDATAGGFRSRTVHHHNYEDTVENARAIAQCILTEGFRISKLRANIFLFTDIKHWEWLQRISAQIGWTPFRRPLIWGKSDSEGLAPWGAQGPRITTEFIFYATKGDKGLLASPIDYQRVNRVPRHERIHAAEKPVELMRKLLECSTLPGDSVLDPCCGSGSTLVAARELGRKALGIEKDPGYYNTAVSNIYKETESAKVQM
jgi:site-specific DNA-methyltransferase (adenine-specific)